jgi:hypothetical protein
VTLCSPVFGTLEVEFGNLEHDVHAPLAGAQKGVIKLEHMVEVDQKGQWQMSAKPED